MNRVVKWESDKLIYEADDKHVTNILFELGFDENTQGLDMPTAKDYDAEGGEDDEELDAHEARRYRRMAATINHLASDRPDLQFTASMLGRTMASGGMTMVGGAVIKSWSNRQATVALSAGEAEFYSAGKAAAELIGIKSMMRDMGWDADIKLHVDATVAQAMANRQGIGKIRHLEVRYHAPGNQFERFREVSGIN